MFGFLIAIAAGAATPKIERPVARPMARALAHMIEIDEGEMRLFAFMIAMIGAGIVSAVFDSGSAIGVTVGGTLGYFGTRLIGWLRGVVDAR